MAFQSAGSSEANTPLPMPFQDFLKTWVYLPTTLWKETFENLFHPQIFLGCNIEDKDEEYKVLNETGSYGKQLSSISKALEVLIAHKPAGLSNEEKLALEQFSNYKSRVDAVLKQSRGPQPAEITFGFVQRLDEALQQRQQTEKDRSEFAPIAKKLLDVAKRRAKAVR